MTIRAVADKQAEASATLELTKYLGGGSSSTYTSGSEGHLDSLYAKPFRK